MGIFRLRSRGKPTERKPAQPSPPKPPGLFRPAMLGLGCVLTLFGAQFLFVDRMILRPIRESKGSEATESQRIIKLPKSIGFILLACGAICVTYGAAFGSRRAAGKQAADF